MCRLLIIFIHHKNVPNLNCMILLPLPIYSEYFITTVVTVCNKIPNKQTTRDQKQHLAHYCRREVVNPLEFSGNYSATSNNMKLVHCPLMGGLLYLVQHEEDWAGPQPAQAPPRCTYCNSTSINGQCTNQHIVV